MRKKRELTIIEIVYSKKQVMGIPSEKIMKIMSWFRPLAEWQEMAAVKDPTRAHDIRGIPQDQAGILFVYSEI